MPPWGNGLVNLADMNCSTDLVFRLLISVEWLKGKFTEWHGRVVY